MSTEEFDKPLERRQRWFHRKRRDPEATGQMVERLARFQGTPRFIIYLTIFVIAWLGWNTLAPEAWRFDSADFGFTALTLMLSLQASYASPMILLAQNRQDERDKVANEQDRQRAARNLNDTEYLMREISGLRMALGELATRDFVRSELNDLRDELDENREIRLAERETRIAELQAELDRLVAERAEDDRRAVEAEYAQMVRASSGADAATRSTTSTSGATEASASGATEASASEVANQHDANRAASSSSQKSVTPKNTAPENTAPKSTATESTARKSTATESTPPEA
ncbi:Uncharacterized membrane protein [Actinobaculum suis]|uniref:DUF1003 domain-containing protein n=1 Tax=Actinobaculum suis TaxID=1657 RepID=A0A1G7DDA5_9ACTO|nr:DUF1003 domain-containing protein [Actinobaculum suis]MDY5153360.1 DUF1003 domain-containing protein [Actinobaculum suis]SDE48970.1 Uncharacterized membrane protein [Actinobaculum suis]